MTPPCLNCHAAPYTSPLEEWESQGNCGPAPEGGLPPLDCLRPALPNLEPEEREALLRWLRDSPPQVPTVASTLALPDFAETSPETLACPAQSRWPEALRSDRPDWQRFPWWVRGNYEAAREDLSPFRIDLESASLDAEARLRPNHSLALSQGLIEYAALHSGASGSVTSHWELRHNEIPLAMQSLVEFHEVSLEVLGLSPSIVLQRASIGDLGGLHFIAQVPTPLMFFLQPFMVPIPPPGCDQPSAEQWNRIESNPNLLEHCFDPYFAAQHLGVCPQGTRLPDRSHASAPLDIDMRNFLPPRIRAILEILFPEGPRLPAYVNLEDLIHAARGLAQVELPPSGGGGPSAAQWWDFLASADFQIDIQELRDFFIPGVVDLGPSRGTLQAHVEDRQVELSLNDFEIQLDAMGYGTREADSPPTLQILGGSIRPGELVSNDALAIEPGIRANLDLNTGLIGLEGNLSVEVQLLLPGLGEVELEGEIIFETQFARSEAGLRPVPSSSTLRISHLNLRSLQDQHAILREVQFSLSDDPRSMRVDDAALSTVSPFWSYDLQGEALGGRTFSLQGRWDLPLDSGLYDFSNLGRGMESDFEIHYLQNSLPAISGNFHTQYSGSDSESGHANHELDLDFDLRRGDETMLDGGAALVRWGDSDSEGTLREVQIALSALFLHWGSIQLHGVSAHLEIQRSQSLGDAETWFRVPNFSLRANESGASSGLLRGPISLTQASERPLDLFWNPAEHRLEMRGLDLSLNAQGLAVLPPTLLQALGLDHATLGMDGHLAGAFTMFFPQDMSEWHGRGDLRLRGDRRGDLYFIDAQGRPIGAPLVRDTRWRFSRIDSINRERGYALGRFNLDLLIDPELLISGVQRPDSWRWPSTVGPEVYDLRGRHLAPYEFEASMPYDNQPASPTGFRNRILDYLSSLFRNDIGACSSGEASAQLCAWLSEICREAEDPPASCERLESEGARP